MDTQNDPNKAQNDTVQEDTGVDMPSTEAEDTADNDAQVDEGNDADAKQVEDADSEQSQSDTESSDAKPSRLERNLYKNIEKRKEAERLAKEKEEELDRMLQYVTSNRQNPQPNADDQSDDLFTQDEIDQGVIADPKQFQERIDRRAEKKAQELFERKQREAEYRQTVQSHVSELEEVQSIEEFQDKEVLDKYLDFYEKVNYLGDQFVGRVSPKELADVFLTSANRIADRKSSNITSKMINQAVNEGVTSSDTHSGSSQSNNLDGLKQKAFSSGSEEDWNNYLKAKLSSPNN